MRILLYIGFICSFILFISSSNGRATNGSGNTGAPGDESVGGNPVTCKFCHSPSAIVTTTTITVLNADGIEVSNYVPGLDYTVKVSIETVSGNPQRYGFQMIGLRDNGDIDLKGFSDPSSNTKLQNISFSNRTYAEHKNAGSLNTFEVKWEAPAIGTGNVSFYAAGNGVNNNGSTNGDGASETKLTLSEAVVSSIDSDQSFSQKILIFPNPVTDGKVFISWDEDINITKYTLLNSAGQIIQYGVAEEIQNTFLNIVDQMPGVYFLSLETNQIRSGSVVKTILVR